MYIYKLVRARFVCKDGVSLSVQASDTAYSTPRTVNGPYTHVEVGFVKDADGAPMEMPESWREYADGCIDEGAPVYSDVFGYIPVELVAEFVEAHGGVQFLPIIVEH